MLFIYPIWGKYNSFLFHEVVHLDPLFLHISLAFLRIRTLRQLILYLIDIAHPKSVETR